MPGASYLSPAGRINKTKGEILGHAQPAEVLGITGSQKKMPMNSGETLVFRRYIPYGATNTDANTINRWAVTAALHLMQEGTNPEADSITEQDITVVMQKYGALYMYTDKVADLHEDDIPAEMKKQAGERIGLVREMIRYGALRQCTNVYYAGGTTRLTVDETVSKNLLANVARGLLLNHAKPITSVLASTPNFNTAGVNAGFLVFVNTNAEYDCEQLPGWIPVTAYGSAKKVVHEMEIGSMGRFRFIVSPDLPGIPDSGAAVGTTGLVSTTGTLIDVYPMIVVAENAWGDVALRGKESIDLIDLKPGMKDKSDPAGTRGYIGGTFYSAATTLNNGWMAVVEIGITNLG